MSSSHYLERYRRKAALLPAAMAAVLLSSSLALAAAVAANATPIAPAVSPSAATAPVAAGVTAPVATADAAVSALQALSVNAASVNPAPTAVPVVVPPASMTTAAPSGDAVAPTPPAPSGLPAAPPGQFVSPRSQPAVTAPAGSAATAAVGSAAGLTQVAMVLVLVVAMIAAIAWLLRRLGMARAAGGSTIRVVSGLNLSNRERILVVEIADQWIVVGVTAASINTLATMPRQESPAGSPAVTTLGGKNFAHWLKQTIDKRNRAAKGLADVKADRDFGSTNGN